MLLPTRILAPLLCVFWNKIKRHKRRLARLLIMANRVEKRVRTKLQRTLLMICQTQVAWISIPRKFLRRLGLSARFSFFSRYSSSWFITEQFQQSNPQNLRTSVLSLQQYKRLSKKMSHLEFQIKSEYLSAQEEPTIHPSLSSKIDASKKVKSRRAIRQNSQKYHWKKMENKRYVEFLTSMRWLFDLTTQEKRNIGINKMMSDYIRTRDSIQCHSHHQKIVKKYGSIDDAVRQMAEEYCSKRRRQPRLAKLMVKIQEVQEDGLRGRHFEEGLSNGKDSTELAATEDPAVKIEGEQHETVK